MDIEIISKEEIKPASPTPGHLRIHRFSILDQLIPHMYSSPRVFFYPNINQSSNVNGHVVLERRERLKKSLSETLVPFYPIAGRIKENLEIECNDEGVYYVEAHVKFQLSEFLKQPKNELIHQLLPFHPGSVELLSKTYLAMIQTNIFVCGSMAIGLYTSHKIADGLSQLTFLKAGAATARNESSQQIQPCFISSSLFPADPNLFNYSVLDLKIQPKEKKSFVTNRFVFDPSALASLKTKAATSSKINPTSVRVVMGIPWKPFIEATKVRYGSQKIPALVLIVNLRSRSSPPLPPHSFGNIFSRTCSACMDDSSPELQLLLNQINGAIDSIDNDFIQGLKGEDRLLKLIGPLKDLQEKYSYTVEPFPISSVCRNGLYEADFGWGKPIWSCMGNGDTDLYGIGNLVMLMDTRSGDGIEARVTIEEELMAIFEKNQELLSFASLNPSPLEI